MGGSGSGKGGRPQMSAPQMGQMFGQAMGHQPQSGFDRAMANRKANQARQQPRQRGGGEGTGGYRPSPYARDVMKRPVRYPGDTKGGNKPSRAPASKPSPRAPGPAMFSLPTRNVSARGTRIGNMFTPPPDIRANMPGRPLTGGEIPMRRGSSYGRYQGPVRRGSILGGSDDEDSSGYSLGAAEGMSGIT